MKNSLLLVFLFLIISFRAYGQSLNVKISATSPAICSGTSTVLTATATGGTPPYTYTWNTGETTPSITVNKATTYTVTVSDKTPGLQPVKQTITISASVTPDAPTAKNAVICQNSAATLTATAPGGVYQWYDAATAGNFLYTGDTYVTPPITSTTIFYVQTTINGCTSLRTPVTVSIIGRPVGTGDIVCKGTQATLSATNGDTFTWYDAPNGNVVGSGSTFLTPPLQNTTTYYVVGIINGCTSTPTPVVATVTPPPQQPTTPTPSITICSGGIANLHADAPAGVFGWFTTPTGGTSLISSPDYTTPPLTATTTYYVQTSLNGCQSPRTPVTVIVNSIPPAPAIAGGTACYGTGASITVTNPTGTYSWFDAPTGGNLLASGTTFNTPAIFSNTTFYVSVNVGGCSSARAPVAVTVTPQVPVPTVSSPLICSGTSAQLTATGSGGTYQWFDAATGGNQLATGANFNTPVLTTNTTYYIQTTIGGCTSARTPITVTILPAAVPPTATGTTVCPGDVATLTATGSAGNYVWYDAPAAGNQLSAGASFITPALTATTTYYVSATTSNGCESTRTPVTVTVNPTPAAPTGTGATTCAGTTPTLGATAAGGTFQWYDAATGGNQVGSGSSFITPVLTVTTTYYVQNTVGTCPSARTAVTATVTPVSTQFKYPSGTICTSGGNITPTRTNPAGGTFSAAPAGLVFISTTTGQINVAASTPGDYIISYAGNGPCPHVTTARISIVTTPNAQFSYSGPFCQSGSNPLPVFPAGSSAGTFTASPAGLSFASTSTGEIDLGASAPGTYTVTNTIAASGGCASSVMTSTVTIDQSVTVSAGPPQTVQSGAIVQLAGSITGGITTGKWSGGAGTFSNPNLPNAVYTPAAGETSVTLTLTSDKPPGPCGAVSSKVTITINPVPAAPTAAGQSTCPGTKVILSATAPGGLYKWFDALTGGTQVGTGPNFTTPVLNANTTYYVQTTIGGFTSTRTPVTVTIEAIPATPAAGPQSACSGGSAILIASGSAGTYGWYDAPVGGNLLSTDATYSTPPLTSPTSYYVQAVVNGCISARRKVDVSINPIPTILSASLGSVCSGNAQSYTITADIPTATFTWSRAAVAGISNPALTGQTSANITEALINTGTTPVSVTYVIVPTAGGCPGSAFNYIVTVFPQPVLTSAPGVTICSSASADYAVTFSSPVSSFSWSRAAVPGISNLAVTGQTATTIHEVLFNASNAPIDVAYVFKYSTPNCIGLTANFTVMVNPVANVTSAPSNLSACSGTAQNYIITSDIPNATFSWSRPAVSGISNDPVKNQTSGTINEALVNTTSHAIRVVYTISALANGCPGPPFSYGVTVNPQPALPVANGNSPVCLGSTIQLNTPTVAGATYLWTGPNNYSSTDQNPNIPNATAANSGVYNLFVSLKGCPSNASPVTIVVDAFPKSDAGPDQRVCHNVTSVQLAGAETGGTPTGIWTTSGTGTFSPSPSKLDAIYIPSATDVAAGSVKLTLASTSKDDCTLSTDDMTIIFQSPNVTSAAFGTICNGVAQNYHMASNTPSVTFTYSRNATAGISNGPVSNVASDIIDETLFNTTNAPINVVYTITALIGDCPGTPFTYTVEVDPTPVTPVAKASTPVCLNGTINLTTPTVANATYTWTGPGGFKSFAQNPVITKVSAASAGVYTVTVTVNGCVSDAGSTDAVVVDNPPVATAGPDQNVCTTSGAVQLVGNITGTVQTGVWTTSGSGTFLPSSTTVNATYTPSAEDKAGNGVVLTLTTTSNDGCAISSDSMNLTFRPAPGVDAGPDQEVCSQDVSVQLAGKILVAGGALWTTSGTGAFSPSATQQDAVYLPSAQDISSGSVTLTLLATGAGPCNISTDKMVIKFIPPPTVDAGTTVFVLHGKTATLNPTVSDNDVTYLWTPNVDIDNNTIKNPTITGDVDMTYTLTVTDSRGCVSTDKVDVKVSPEVVIPNTFTPNNDGINDIWNIQGLIAYTRATVDVFDRYGQKVFHSIGYPKAWDGTYGGKFLPTGTYYYIIDTKFNNQVLSGAVTIVR